MLTSKILLLAFIGVYAKVYESNRFAFTSPSMIVSGRGFHFSFHPCTGVAHCDE
jgi:hypothetical protein